MATSPDPEALRCSCTRCGYPLWDRRGGQWTLRASVLKVDGDGSLVARCPQSGCQGDVDVPFLDLVEPEPVQPEEPVETAPRRRRLVVRRG